MKNKDFSRSGKAGSRPGPGRNDTRKPGGAAPGSRQEKPTGHKGKAAGKASGKPPGKSPGKPAAHGRPAGRKPAGPGRRDARADRSGTDSGINIKGMSANLWGVHAVQEAWLNPARTIHRLYVTETALESFEELRAEAAARGLKRPDPFMLDRRTLDRLLPPGAVHQGLAVDAAPLEELFVQDLLAAGAGKPRATLLILDQLTDPHNVGAIMRSASAFGAAGIIMQTRHSPEITGVLAKSACGAVEHIPVAYETNLGRALTLLQENGYTAVGLDERGPVTLAEIGEKPAKTVIILGAEGKGLRQHLRDQCDILARLPTQGAIQSLNVSNAAAVALYALL